MDVEKVSMEIRSYIRKNAFNCFVEYSLFYIIFFAVLALFVTILIQSYFCLLFVVVGILVSTVNYKMHTYVDEIVFTGEEVHLIQKNSVIFKVKYNEYSVVVFTVKLCLSGVCIKSTTNNNSMFSIWEKQFTQDNWLEIVQELKSHTQNVTNDNDYTGWKYIN